MNTTPILDRSLEGELLEEEEGLALLTAGPEDHQDILRAADDLNQRINGPRVSYVVNRNLNFTNICYTGCKFCNFRRSKFSPEAYVFSIEEAVASVVADAKEGITEVCIQGGINPEIGFDYYCELLRGLKRAMPELHIHAFSPMEIAYLTDSTGMPEEEVVGALRESGLGSTPGTGAEIFHPEVRSVLCTQKLTAERWEKIIRIVHDHGIPSTSTMLFGHIEKPHHVIHHLKTLRGIQQDTGGITEFVPLLFIPYKTQLGRVYQITDVAARPYTERVYAVSRLFLGRMIPNLQTSWVKLGVRFAAQTLACGVNDFGGTLLEERITKAAGGTHGTLLTVNQIRQAIAGAGRRPVRRDTVYNLYEEEPATV